MNITAKKNIWRIALTVGASLFILFAMMVVMGMLVSAAPAATPIYVRTDGDDVNCDGTTNVAYPGSGTGLQCAVQTIGQGISLVDVGGTVVVGSGTYIEDVTIPKDVALQGAGDSNTIIDGSGSGTVVYVTNTGTDATVSGVTIRNAGGTTGVGIHVGSGTALTLTDSTVSDNTSCTNCSGAGLFLASGSATAVVSNCTFSDNEPANINADGGAINNQGGKLTVVGSTFIGNSAGGRGGAIHSRGFGSVLTVIDSVFSTNTVTGTTNPSGGAIWHDTGTMVISNTTFLNNSTGGIGGAIATSGGTAFIYGSLFANNWGMNVGSCYGGGIRNYNTTMVIEDSVLRDNWVSGTASHGGGLFTDGPTTLNRVTISGNSSTGWSGGIHSQDPLTMTNVTVSGNTASDTAGGLMQTGSAVAHLVNCTIVSNTLTGSPFGGGGLHIYATVNMTNTLLADNDSANCGVSGSLNSGGHNLEDGDSCNLGATGDVTSTDPLLLPLSTYGGPLVGATASQEQMHVHAFSRNSPALDAGDDAICPAVDQRGVSRPIDGDGDSTATCDIGAFEYDLVNAVFLPLVLKDY